jgi:hypothetical protein
MAAKDMHRLILLGALTFSSAFCHVAGNNEQLGDAKSRVANCLEVTYKGNTASPRITYATKQVRIACDEVSVGDYPEVLEVSPEILKKNREMCGAGSYIILGVIPADPAASGTSKTRPAQKKGPKDKLVVLSEHQGPVIGPEYLDVKASNNRSGFETGQPIKANK